MRTGWMLPSMWALVMAQTWAGRVNVHINNNVHLPLPGPNGCAKGYYPGVDEVLYTVPYTYRQVLSIVGNYTNLTWSGIPDNAVVTNNSFALCTNFWTPRTARFYSFAGADVVETITKYFKPFFGPYVEVHTLAPITIASENNLKAYAPFDGQVWTPICGGRAVRAKFTTRFCASDAARAGVLFHAIHLNDAETVGIFLGGRKFTGCRDLWI